MDVVVVLVLPAWSRALATTMAFSDRLLIRLRRARTPSLSLTVRVLPTGDGQRLLGDDPPAELQRQR